MIDLLRNPALFVFCLLAMANDSPTSSPAAGSRFGDAAKGLAPALWSLVIASLFPALFLDAHLGTGYLLIAHSNSALFWLPFLVLILRLLPPLPVTVLASASAAALIASPHLLRFDLLIGGLTRLDDPQSGLLVLLIPIVLAAGRARPVMAGDLPFALHTLFLGLIPASMLLPRSERSILSVPAALGGSFMYLLCRQALDISTPFCALGGVVVALLVEWSHTPKGEVP